jgi:hypothetical protein
MLTASQFLSSLWQSDNRVMSSSSSSSSSVVDQPVGSPVPPPKRHLFASEAAESKEEQEESEAASWVPDEARGQQRLDALMRESLEHTVRAGSLEEAYRVCQQLDLHLVGRVHLNADGNMHWEGFAPWDVLCLLLNLTATTYMPDDASDKKRLCAGHVVCKCIFVSDLDWSRIMQNQVVSALPAPDGAYQPTTSFLRVRHSQSSIATFSLDEALRGPQELRTEFTRVLASAVWIYGVVYWMPTGCVHYEGFVPLARALEAMDLSRSNVRPTLHETNIRHWVWRQMESRLPRISPHSTSARLTRCRMHPTCPPTTRWSDCGRGTLVARIVQV